MSYKSNQFNLLEQTLDTELRLPDGSSFVSDIHTYFECIIKKHEALTANPPLQVYLNRPENQVTFKIKTRYYCKVSTHEVMKLLGRLIKIKNETKKV